MDLASPGDESSVVEVYLHQLDSLAAELDTAFKAIAANNLAAVKASVTRQEFLTASLSAMLRAVTRHLHGNPAPSPSLRSRMTTAARGLHAANQNYAALLKNTGGTIAMLLSLCRSHSDNPMEIRGTSSARQTWSCEM